MKRYVILSSSKAKLNLKERDEFFLGFLFGREKGKMEIFVFVNICKPMDM